MGHPHESLYIFSIIKKFKHTKKKRKTKEKEKITTDSGCKIAWIRYFTSDW